MSSPMKINCEIEKKRNCILSKFANLMDLNAELGREIKQGRARRQTKKFNAKNDKKRKKFGLFLKAREGIAPSYLLIWASLSVKEQ